MDDLISRQHLINEIWKIRRSQQLLDDTQRSDLVMHGLYLVEKVVEELPSALIRCKDCKWFNEPGCSIRIVDDSDKPSEKDYCSFAELDGDDK